MNKDHTDALLAKLEDDLLAMDALVSENEQTILAIVETVPVNDSVKEKLYAQVEQRQAQWTELQEVR